MPELTPMLAQYQEIKARHPHELLFFRLGDFYEMFGDDARTASRILDIVLTARNKGTAHETPMCGIPHHALNSYLNKLLKAGQRVAVCEQLSDPTLPGLVKREVVRVITPGTTLETLESKDNNFIVSLVRQKNIFGLAVGDLTTGEFQTTELSNFNLLVDEIFRLNPSEVIVSRDLFNDAERNDFIRSLKNALPFQLPTFQKQEDVLLKHFNVNNLSSFGLSRDSSAVLAAANLLFYLKDTQKTDLQHITKISRYQFSDFMSLDEATLRHLEIFQTMSDANVRGGLLFVIDKTITNQGGRLLRQWLRWPLLKSEAIEQRLGAVEELKADSVLIRNVINILTNTADLQRVLGRVGCRRANARDLVALRSTLKLLPQLKSLLLNKKSDVAQRFQNNLPDFASLVGLLEQVILDEPSTILTEGNMIKEGYNKELDELKRLRRDAKDWLVNFQTKEIERTGISSLKVRFNQVFGYYIEISKANLNQAPLDYLRKQTLVNAERFITPELNEYEERILGAEERIFNLENQIFWETVEHVIKFIPQIQIGADLTAELDVLVGFARLANENNYCRPHIIDAGELFIKNGRHPVIETFTRERYVPNDLQMDHDKQELILLTGPNMSGKSSFLRQTALIVLLAQIGCFVPAEEARLGIVDKIFTRVGASDNVAQGVSTFMAEMQEAANILNNATNQSLVILDELGRGTSTYDGLSIAWAIIEYIHDTLHAKTLFATHYHELTHIVKTLTRAENYCVAVSESDGRVVFLHKIIHGASSESYGIEVARLAGLPDQLTSRAQQLLVDLETNREIKIFIPVSQPDNQTTRQPACAGRPDNQLVLPPLKKVDVEEKLRNKISELKIEEMTPIEAMEKLIELRRDTKSGS